MSVRNTRLVLSCFVGVPACIATSPPVSHALLIRLFCPITADHSISAFAGVLPNAYSGGVVLYIFGVSGSGSVKMPEVVYSGLSSFWLCRWRYVFVHFMSSCGALAE